MAVAVAALTIPIGGGVERPALRAWKQAHERERKRMGLRTQDAYAQWLGIDPAQWSKWRTAARAVPVRQGRRLVALFDHDQRWAGLWLRLAQEQELHAIASAPSDGTPLPLDVARRRGPAQG